jgi:hypothetical protein
MRAVRAGPVFEAADIAIVAVVVPLAPDVIVSQAASLVAFHAHPASVLS